MENGSDPPDLPPRKILFFYVYNALLSRSSVFEFKSVPAEEIRPAVLRALEVIEGRTPLPLMEPEVPALVAQGCGGDVRKSINAVELLCEAAVPKDGTLLLTEADAKALAQRSAMRYDRGGDAYV